MRTVLATTFAVGALLLSSLATADHQMLTSSAKIGMGDTLDKAHSVSLGSGGYAVAPANMHHYAWTKSGATIQVHMMGPFAITYVNPADDPAHAAAK